MSRFATRIRPVVDAEIALARAAEARGRFDTAFRHLERAHVLGQRSTTQHVRVHWLMLGLALRNRVALRRRWAGEALGQLWRLLAAAVFTPLGLLPSGNTGGADVSGFRRLPVPAELRRLLESAE